MKTNNSTEKNNKKDTKPVLRFNREVLRKLTTEDLTAVVGGAGTGPTHDTGNTHCVMSQCDESGI